jgi:hypothetical protein
VSGGSHATTTTHSDPSRTRANLNGNVKGSGTLN